MKTDKRDSLKLAEQLDANRLRGIYVPSEARELRRLLTRTREQLVRARTRVERQIRMKLHQFGLFSLEYRKVISETLVGEILEKGVPEELEISIRVLLLQWRELKAHIKTIKQEFDRQAEVDPHERIY